MELISVAALADTHVIGDEGELPWPSIPTDKRQYRERIADEPVIFGRVTFDSMREDLPGSHQVVLSRSNQTFDIETAHHADSVDEAIAIADELGATRAYVIGGGAVYRLFQPHADRMVLSRVHGEYEGDTYYPEWDTAEWELAAEQEYDRFTLEEWVRSDDQ